RIKNPQIFQHKRELHEGNEVESQLLITCSQPAGLLQPAHGAFDPAPLPIGLLIKLLAGRWSLIALARNHRLNPATLKMVTDFVVTVAFVAGQLDRPAEATRPTHLVHQAYELRRFVRLSRREGDAKGKALSVSDQVEFAAPSAAAATQCVIVRLGIRPLFFRAPAAAREARTLEPSTSHRSQSILPCLSSRICRALRIRSKVPSARQRLKR